MFKKILKWTGIGTGALILAIVVVVVAVSGHGTKTANTVTSTTPPVVSQAPSAPTVVPPDKVEFIISGYAPGDPACGGGCDPSISYGSNSDTHNLSEAVNGTLTFSLPFDPNAEFYDVSVNTTADSSHLSCKIVVTGPAPDVPLTASSASETGSGVCDAQAAPTDSTGESWQSE